MDRATAARIQEWDERPVSGGYRGLQELADASFTGAVSTGTTWLFMLNGRIVGVVDGSVAAFESGEATAYHAPDPGLPLLYAMQAQGGEPRAKYYTDDNPLPEVHETLADAGFTGYLELSENVLSGDYYVVYYGGKSMSVAFVGNAERLLTGDEAFREAADEVGIYQVVDIELDVREVPEQEDEPAGAAAVAPDTGNEAVEEPEEPEEPATDPTPEPELEPDPEPDPEPAAAADPTPESEPVQDPAEEEPVTEPPPDEPTDTSAEPEPTPNPERVETASRNEGTEPAGEATGDDDPFSQEAAWRETRTIPALDPEESESPAPAAEDSGQQASPNPAPEPEPSSPDPEPAPEPEPEPEPEPVAEAPGEDRIAELEAAVEAQSETIAELESRLESTSSEARQLREEREALEAELESARAGDGAAGTSAPTGKSLAADAALDQTDLFVRYGTKGGGTLEKAHDGKIDREEVVNNLRIDHHTRFEEREVTVDGQPFMTFLEDSLEYRFVHWLVTEFLFEILDTGSQRGLREVFDAIPLIDRAEFHGTVTWRDQDAGETHSEAFDVVCRDRMGQALIVANLNDARDPATDDMMASLLEGASTIAEGTESLGGAFMVTSSFFRPDALESASEATGGGLLSREKRWSYVKLSRRHGYHLCLVEARGDDFHVAVPEL